MRRDRRSVFFVLALTCAVALAAAAQQVSRTYYVVFLRRDPARTTLSKEDGDRIQSAHMANIHAMAERGVLVAAGPFEDDPPVISGVFFFLAQSAEEARNIALADPTVREHRNTVDMFAWRGPAGIGDEYKRLHKENPSTPEDMGVHPFLILRRSSKQLDGAAEAKHHAYWSALRASGKVVAAGPVEGDESAAEILIFDRIPDVDAAFLAAADPAVAAGAFTVEAHRWWSAAHVFPR